MTIGAFIRQRRDLLGLNQEDVAHAAGMHTSAFSNLENDKRKTFPTPEELRGIAGILGVSVAELLREAGYLPEDEGMDESGILRVRQYELRRELTGIRDRLDRAVREIDQYYERHNHVITNGGPR